MNLGVAVSREARRRPGALALFSTEYSCTYAELDERTNRLARWLRDAHDVSTGDRLAVLLPNRCEVVEYLVAAHKAALVYVGLNFRMDDSDLRSVFENAEPRLLVTCEEFRATAEMLQEAFGVPFVMIEDLVGTKSPLKNSSAEPLGLFPASGDHACIVYTSGTTGRPKGVLFDHSAMSQHATVACLEYEITPDTRYLIQIPHNSSVNITIAPCLMMGAAIGFQDSRSFSPDTFASVVAQFAVTHSFLVPTQLMRVLDQLTDDDRRMSTLTTLGYGSSPISPDRLRDLVARYGPIFLQLYGMAEIASIGTILRKVDHERALGDKPALLNSCGRPSYGVAVRVVDDNGNDVPVGERGEVVFAGPHVMLGYYRDEKRTSDALYDGWMHSGDIGVFDDEGYLYIVDRLKNLIIRGGLNIAPVEIENVIYRHPGVLEVAVVGAPDEEWGERIVAVVARTTNGTVTEQEILDLCRNSELASIKRPEEVRFVDSLPKNAVGKIDKGSVRNQFWTGTRQV
ncbi:MAG: class I adenylate-forming enzyme family protein [Ilumatobacteraceae bacterium]